MIDPWDYEPPWSKKENKWWTNISFTIDLERRFGNLEAYSLGLGISYIQYNGKAIIEL